MLQAQNVSVCLGGQTILRNISFSLAPGQWLMLVGPNGAGKSTLIQAISQGVPYTGDILLDNEDIKKLRPTQRAQKIGVLSQQHSVGYAYIVEEIVQLGRYAHRKGFLSPADNAGMIDQSLALTGMEKLRHRKMTELSGGEIQRAFLAQVFAQDPDILILDEPANHLDLVYQKQIFSILTRWLSQPGRAILSVVHDLSLARRYGSHALLMKEGCCIAQGNMDDVLTPDKLQAVYDMDVYDWMRQLLSTWTN